MEKFNTSQRYLTFQKRPKDQLANKSKPQLTQSIIPSSLQELIKKYSSKYSKNPKPAQNLKIKGYLRLISKIFKKKLKLHFSTWKLSIFSSFIPAKTTSLSGKPSVNTEGTSIFSQTLTKGFSASSIMTKIPANLKTIQKLESSLRILRLLKRVLKNCKYFSFSFIKIHSFQANSNLLTQKNTKKHKDLKLITSSGFSITPYRKKSDNFSVTQQPSFSLFSSREADSSSAVLKKINQIFDLNPCQTSRTFFCLSSSNLVQSDDSLVELEGKNEELSPNFNSLGYRDEVVVNNALKSTSTSRVPQRFQFGRYNVRESQNDITEMSLSSFGSVGSENREIKQRSLFL